MENSGNIEVKTKPLSKDDASQPTFSPDKVKVEPLTLDDASQATFGPDKYLVYPFVSGEAVEFAAKDLSLCDYTEDVSHESLITLQLDHVVGRSHILMLTEDDRNMLLPKKLLNDTLIDFWVRWIARNQPFTDTNVLTFTSHFYSTLRTDGVQAVSRWVHRRKLDLFSKDLILFPINYDNVHWSLGAILNPKKIEAVLQQGVTALTDLTPFILHMDSLNLHNSKEIGNNLRSWLNHEYGLLFGATKKEYFSEFRCPVICPKGNVH